MACARCSGGAESVTVTHPPRDARKRANAAPSRARPNISTRCPSTSMESLAERKRDTRDAAQHADDPETLRDLILVPADQLQMVVERAHAKETPATGQLEVPNLQHDRDRDDEED